MNGFAQAAAARPLMALQMPAANAPIGNNMMQPGSARFDATNVPETNGAPRPAHPPDNPHSARILAILNQRMPDLALAYRQKRLTPEQNETVNVPNTWRILT